MNFDLTDLLILFDELDHSSEEELGYFWLKYSKENEFKISLIISKPEAKAILSVETMISNCSASLCLNNCNKIRVLDFEKKCLEIWHDLESSRCFLSFSNEVLMEYENNCQKSK
jgi:hypothetical protein